MCVWGMLNGVVLGCLDNCLSFLRSGVLRGQTRCLWTRPHTVSFTAGTVTSSSTDTVTEDGRARSSTSGESAGRLQD